MIKVLMLGDDIHRLGRVGDGWLRAKLEAHQQPVSGRCEYSRLHPKSQMIGEGGRTVPVLDGGVTNGYGMFV